MARGRSTVPANQNAGPKVEVGPQSANHSVQVTREEWSGPLPPPAILKGFNEIVPGAAERILTEFELEAAHRRQLENKQASVVSRDLLVSQLAALIFAICALAVAAFSASVGAEWIGTIVGGGTIAAVVLAFLKSRSD